PLVCFRIFLRLARRLVPRFTRGMKISLVKSKCEIQMRMWRQTRARNSSSQRVCLVELLTAGALEFRAVGRQAPVKRCLARNQRKTRKTIIAEVGPGPKLIC